MFILLVVGLVGGLSFVKWRILHSTHLPGCLATYLLIFLSAWLCAQFVKTSLYRWSQALGGFNITITK